MVLENHRISHVIPKHQLFGMWVQIHLVTKVMDVVHSHVMLHEGERYHKRYEPVVIVGNEAFKLAPFSREKV